MGHFDYKLLQGSATGLIYGNDFNMSEPPASSRQPPRVSRRTTEARITGENSVVLTAARGGWRLQSNADRSRNFLAQRRKERKRKKLFLLISENSKWTLQDQESP